MQIYEADFTESSYGYRPGRTPHQALDQLGRTIQQRKVNYVVEADIKGFFDHLNQKWLIEFLRHRVGDERVLRLVVRMLKSGVMEDGLVRASDEGVPQGGNLSPLLSNVYLHYTLDLWFVHASLPLSCSFCTTVGPEGKLKSRMWEIRSYGSVRDGAVIR